MESQRSDIERDKLKEAGKRSGLGKFLKPNVKLPNSQISNTKRTVQK